MLDGRQELDGWIVSLQIGINVVFSGADGAFPMATLIYFCLVKCSLSSEVARTVNSNSEVH